MPAVGLESVDGLEQAEACHLDQILQRLTGMAIAAGELACERHEAHHELLARGDIPVAVVPLQQPLVLASSARSIEIRRLSWSFLSVTSRAWTVVSTTDLVFRSGVA